MTLLPLCLLLWLALSLLAALLLGVFLHNASRFDAPENSTERNT